MIRHHCEENSQETVKSHSFRHLPRQFSPLFDAYLYTEIRGKVSNPMIGIHSRRPTTHSYFTEHTKDTATFRTRFEILENKLCFEKLDDYFTTNKSG